tara:strand:+ start:7052 stop:7834 length:783 start_codon:yes stop_codon:yes gene_type:complete
MYILFDTSYLFFYRIYALKNWYKKAKPEVTDIYNDSEFLIKLEKMTIKCITDLLKKNKITDPKNVYFLKDCAQANIWRNEHIGEYKAGRVNEIPKEVFKFLHNTVLSSLIDKNDWRSLYLDKLEADDIAFILKNQIREKYPDSDILIITNDNDYLQLIDKKTRLQNLCGKDLSERSCGNPSEDLLMKIILGDNSDNIPKVFPKCGPKTAQKYIKTPGLLEDMLTKENYNEIFQRNRRLIDFNYIPHDLQEIMIVIINEEL